MASGRTGQGFADHTGITALVEWARNTSSETGVGIFLRSGHDQLSSANLSAINEFAVAWNPRKMRVSLAAFRAQRQTGCPVLAGRL